VGIDPSPLVSCQSGALSLSPKPLTSSSLLTPVSSPSGTASDESVATTLTVTTVNKAGQMMKQMFH
jgi:hypothetical protein